MGLSVLRIQSFRAHLFGFAAYEQWSGGYNGFYNNGTGVAFGSPQTIISSDPYQSTGAGSYYLPSTSSFLTLGTTNVNSALAVAIRDENDRGPLILTNTFTNYTVLTPLLKGIQRVRRWAFTMIQLTTFQRARFRMQPCF